MTQEDKELLIKDLSARLPYNVICQFYDSCRVINSRSEPIYDGVLSERSIDLFRNHVGFTIKPYLRTMSSMTDEEWREYKDIIYYCKHSYEEIDWLNAHHIDYRDLIDRCLAIEVTEENNPYK